MDALAIRHQLHIALLCFEDFDIFQKCLVDTFKHEVGCLFAHASRVIGKAYIIIRACLRLWHDTMHCVTAQDAHIAGEFEWL